MRRFVLTVFDGYVYINPIPNTPTPYDPILGAVDTLVFHVNAKNVAGVTATLTVNVQHSGDSQTWLQLANSSAMSLSTVAETNFIFAVTGPFQAFVRLRVSLSGTGASAQVKIIACGRDKGRLDASPAPIRLPFDVARFPSQLTRRALLELPSPQIPSVAVQRPSTSPQSARGPGVAMPAAWARRSASPPDIPSPSHDALRTTCAEQKGTSSPCGCDTGTKDQSPAESALVLPPTSAPRRVPAGRTRLVQPMSAMVAGSGVTLRSSQGDAWGTYEATPSSHSGFEPSLLPSVPSRPQPLPPEPDRDGGGSGDPGEGHRRIYYAVPDLASPAGCDYWRPSIWHPVHYGVSRHETVPYRNAAPIPLRIIYPSVQHPATDGPILEKCGGYPLIVFTHGECGGFVGDSAIENWVPIFSRVARAGFVVVIPGYNDPVLETIEDAKGYASMCREVVSWMTTQWAHSSLLSDKIAVAGHSFGGVIGAVLASEVLRHTPAQAYASLSGQFEVFPEAQTALANLGQIPKLFIHGDSLQTEPYSGDYMDSTRPVGWGSAERPRHSVYSRDGEHWDYLQWPTTCPTFIRGECFNYWMLVSDILTTFFSRYLVTEAGIRRSLIPPTPGDVINHHQTQEQRAFVLVDQYMAGAALFQAMCARDRITFTWDTFHDGLGKQILPAI